MVGGDGTVVILYGKSMEGQVCMVAGLCKVWEEMWRKGKYGDQEEWEKGVEGEGEGEGLSFHISYILSVVCKH